MNGAVFALGYAGWVVGYLIMEVRLTTLDIRDGVSIKMSEWLGRIAFGLAVGAVIGLIISSLGRSE